jgi:hypothetical protein
VPRECFSTARAEYVRARIEHLKTTLGPWAREEGADPDVAVILASGLFVQDSARIARLGGFDPTLARTVAARARAGGIWFGRGRIGAEWTGRWGEIGFLLDVMTASGAIHRYRHDGVAYYSHRRIGAADRRQIRAEAELDRRSGVTAVAACRARTGEPSWVGDAPV